MKLFFAVILVVTICLIKILKAQDDDAKNLAAVFTAWFQKENYSYNFEQVILPTSLTTHLGDAVPLKLQYVYLGQFMIEEYLVIFDKYYKRLRMRVYYFNDNGHKLRGSNLTYFDLAALTWESVTYDNCTVYFTLEDHLYRAKNKECPISALPVHSVTCNRLTLNINDYPHPYKHYNLVRRNRIFVRPCGEYCPGEGKVKNLAAIFTGKFRKGEETFIWNFEQVILPQSIFNRSTITLKVQEIDADEILAQYLVVFDKDNNNKIRMRFYNFSENLLTNHSRLTSLDMANLTADNITFNDCTVTFALERFTYNAIGVECSRKVTSIYSASCLRLRLKRIRSNEILTYEKIDRNQILDRWTPCGDYCCQDEELRRLAGLFTGKFRSSNNTLVFNYEQVYLPNVNIFNESTITLKVQKIESGNITTQYLVVFDKDFGQLRMRYFSFINDWPSDRSDLDTLTSDDIAYDNCKLIFESYWLYAFITIDDVCPSHAKEIYALSCSSVVMGSHREAIRPELAVIDRNPILPHWMPCEDYCFQELDDDVRRFAAVLSGVFVMGDGNYRVKITIEQVTLPYIFFDQKKITLKVQEKPPDSDNVTEYLLVLDKFNNSLRMGIYNFTQPQTRPWSRQELATLSRNSFTYNYCDVFYIFENYYYLSVLETCTGNDQNIEKISCSMLHKEYRGHYRRFHRYYRGLPLAYWSPKGYFLSHYCPISTALMENPHPNLP